MCDRSKHPRVCLWCEHSRVCVYVMRIFKALGGWGVGVCCECSRRWMCAVHAQSCVMWIHRCVMWCVRVCVRDWWEVGMGERKCTEMFSMDMGEDGATCLRWGQRCNQNFSFSPMDTQWLRGWCSEKVVYEVQLKETYFLGFPGGAVVENLPANAGDTGSSPGLGRSHVPRSSWAREAQLLSLCSAIREATTVRGPRTVMRSGPRLPQLEKALAQKRRPNTASKQASKQASKKETYFFSKHTFPSKWVSPASEQSS